MKHFLFGPGQSCLPDAVLGSIHPRRVGVQDGVELHGVQVPPLTRLGVIGDGTGFAAFGTVKWCSLRMFDVHVNLLGIGFKFDISHEPGSLESENLLVEFGFLDRCSFARLGSPYPNRKTQQPKVPASRQQARNKAPGIQTLRPRIKRALQPPTIRARKLVGRLRGRLSSLARLTHAREKKFWQMNNRLDAPLTAPWRSILFETIA